MGHLHNSTINLYTLTPSLSESDLSIETPSRISPINFDTLTYFEIFIIVLR